MCVHDIRNVQNDQLYEFGYQPEFLHLFEKHYPQTGSRWRRASLEKSVTCPTLTQVCSDEELFESRFYRELLQPFGYLDFIGFMALRAGARVASIHTSRSELAPRYGARDISVL